MVSTLSSEYVSAKRDANTSVRYYWNGLYEVVVSSFMQFLNILPAETYIRYVAERTVARNVLL